MKVTLDREEALALIMALENKKRLYSWEKSALDKLLEAMGLNSIDIWVKGEVIKESE